MKIFIPTFILLILTSSSIALQKLQEQFSWSAIDYEYASDADRVQALYTKRFIPENNLPVGIEVWNNKLFVTVPRWRAGIPSTLNYIPLNSPTKSPNLIPYPSWSANELGNCETGLSTVYRIKADACDRLWVLDTGTFGIANTTQNPCPYALNIFDLRTDRRLRRYVLPAADTNANTFIANIAVDLGASCDDAFAYLSDELGYGLIAYSLAQNRSWRFTHGFFLPDPLAGAFRIAGLAFEWFEEGIFGMALSARRAGGDRVLYFSPLASNRDFAVSTATLRNESKVGNSYDEFVALADRGPLGHTTARVMDEANGVQLFNLIDRNAIGCWDSGKVHGRQTVGVVDRDDEALIFPADIKIDRSNFVWVISDRMSTFLLSGLDFINDVNFRIFWAPLEDLIGGTICDPTPIYKNYL